MKKGKSNWELVIEWFDEDKYRHLPETDKKLLNDFRRKLRNINQLTETIEKDQKKVEKLMTGIRDRKEKIRLHKLDGKKLFKQVEHLKNQHHVEIYYSEGQQNRILQRSGKPVKYPISNLKIKYKFTDTIKTISLKPTRVNNINLLKSHFPEWINSLNMIKIMMKGEKGKVYYGNQIIEFFRPTIERIFNEYPEELRHGSYKLNLDKLIEEKKKDMGL